MQESHLLTFKYLDEIQVCKFIRGNICFDPVTFCFVISWHHLSGVAHPVVECQDIGFWSWVSSNQKNIEEVALKKKHLTHWE